MATKRLPKIIQKPTTIRFSEDLRLRGERAAERIGVSFSDLCRMAVIEYLAAKSE